eukprot:gb/GECG01011259.1/.p1 GENE.gb/GECG01011259.1/~~gb/GECG01011259.1/.p1  ORF type:complete len:529 (+),score=70.49 gb/GECG01011259.1/:1-1587(+)
MASSSSESDATAAGTSAVVAPPPRHSSYQSAQADVNGGSVQRNEPDAISDNSQRQSGVASGASLAQPADNDAGEAQKLQKKPLPPTRRKKSTNKRSETNPKDDCSVEARRLFLLSKVFIQSVSTDGTIRPEAFGEMNIIKTPDEQGKPLVFLMIEDFSYPLVGQPIMNCGVEEDGHRTYIMPADHQHSFTMQLNEKTSSIKIKQLEFFLRAYATLRDREEGPIEVPPEVAEEARSIESGSTESAATSEADPTHWTDYVVSALSSASRVTATGIVSGADYTARAISWAGDVLKRRTNRCDSDLEISESAKNHLTTARAVTSSAVAVSSGLVHGVTYVSSVLGKQLSGAVAQTEYGKQLSSATSSATGRNFRKIGAASLVAFSELWDAMEVGAKRVGSSTASATTDYVQHRYGSAYAAAANEGLTAAGNSALAMYHLKGVGWSALARYTVRDTAVNTLGIGPEENAASVADTESRSVTSASEVDDGSSRGILDSARSSIGSSILSWWGPTTDSSTATSQQPETGITTQST